MTYRIVKKYICPAPAIPAEKSVDPALGADFERETLGKSFLEPSDSTAEFDSAGTTD